MINVIYLLLMLALTSGTTSALAGERVADRDATFASSSLCRNCHSGIYEQYSESMHSNSASNPIYAAQYNKELVPLLSGSKELVQEAKRCTACHNPEEYVLQGAHITTPGEFDPRKAPAVTCDFCHSVTGYSESEPGNGNYISKPGDIKSRHSSRDNFSRVLRKSEFCGICHNAVNHHGLAVKSTYSEWKASPFAKAKIQCQDCHMNREGFLTNGKASFERGEVVTAGMIGSTPKKRKIFNHRFPGAHAASQVDGSLGLFVSAPRTTFAPGQEVEVKVTIDNTRAGHKMPTGSLDLRVLWLDVKAYAGNTEIPVQLAMDRDTNTYATSGVSSDDRDLVEDIPMGNRVYRAVLKDAAGKRTFSSYEAAKIGYDNRLNAAEVRDELFRIVIPASATGSVTVKASLKYLPYTSSFARKLEIGNPVSQEIAKAQAEVSVRSAP